MSNFAEANHDIHEQSVPAVTASPQDAYPPVQIARLVGEAEVRKDTISVIQTTMLGVLGSTLPSRMAVHEVLMGLGHKASGEIAFREPATASGTARRVDARADHGRVPTSTCLIQVNEGRPERG
jgi:hypothetical protein